MKLAITKPASIWNESRSQRTYRQEEGWAGAVTDRQEEGWMGAVMDACIGARREPRRGATGWPERPTHAYGSCMHAPASRDGIAR